jgi:hypothetical protein
MKPPKPKKPVGAVANGQHVRRIIKHPTLGPGILIAYIGEVCWHRTRLGARVDVAECLAAFDNKLTRIWSHEIGICAANHKWRHSHDSVLHMNTYGISDSMVMAVAGLAMHGPAVIKGHSRAHSLRALARPRRNMVTVKNGEARLRPEAAMWRRLELYECMRVIHRETEGMSEAEAVDLVIAQRREATQ